MPPVAMIGFVPNDHACERSHPKRLRYYLQRNKGALNAALRVTSPHRPGTRAAAVGVTVVRRSRARAPWAIRIGI